MFGRQDWPEWIRYMRFRWNDYLLLYGARSCYRIRIWFLTDWQHNMQDKNQQNFTWHNISFTRIYNNLDWISWYIS